MPLTKDQFDHIKNIIQSQPGWLSTQAGAIIDMLFSHYHDENLQLEDTQNALSQIDAMITANPNINPLDVQIVAKQALGFGS